MEERIVDFNGRKEKAVVVEIAESTVRFSHVRLEDGTTLKMMTSAIEVMRVMNCWIDNGNPVYLVHHQTVISVIRSPDRLKKRDM